MKKIISLLLSVVMVLSLVSVTAFAASPTVYLTSTAAGTTINADDTFTVKCCFPDPTTFTGVKAGLYFNTDELEVTKITGGTITWYDEENDSDETYSTTAKSTKTTANETGIITYTYAGPGVAVECSGGTFFTVTFKAKSLAADTVASIKIAEQNDYTGYKIYNAGEAADAGLNITIKGAAQEEPVITPDNGTEDANDAKTWAVAVDANYVAAGDKLIATLTNSNFTGEDATQVVELTVDGVDGGADWAFNLKVRFKDVVNRAATTLAIAKAN